MKKNTFVQTGILILILLCIGNTNLVGQSFIINGDFSEGISANWQHRIKDGNQPFTEQNGKLVAQIQTAPSGWWETGIISLKKDNTFEIEQIVKVSFKLETTAENAKVKCVLYTPQIDESNPQYSNSADVDLQSGSHEYIAYIQNTNVSRSNYEFNLFFLNAGTFTLDDISVELINLGSNLASTATISTNAPEGDVSKIIDGNKVPWSGWSTSSVDAQNPAPYWVELAWSVPQQMNAVKLYTIDNPGYAVQDYTIQYWNGSDYQDLTIVRNNTTSMVTSGFNPISTDKLRFYFTGPDQVSAWYRVDEIEVFKESAFATGIHAPSKNGTDIVQIYSTSVETIIQAPNDIQQLHVYSLNGNRIINKVTTNGANTYRIMNESLTPGLYIVVVNNTYRSKFIIK